MTNLPFISKAHFRTSIASGGSPLTSQPKSSSLPRNIKYAEKVLLSEVIEDLPPQKTEPSGSADLCQW